MFLGSLIALFAGIFPGILGVWVYYAWKYVVPEYIKVGHAHASWWAVLIVIAALFLPGAPLKRWVKKFIAFTSVAATPVWMAAISAYYLGKEASGVHAIISLSPLQIHSWGFLLYGMAMFLLEVWIFWSLGLVFLSVLGAKIPLISSDDTEKSKYELMTDIEIPVKIFRTPLIFALLGILMGWGLILFFKLPDKAITPAALVQLHTHIFFFIVGYILTMITMKVAQVKESVFNFTCKLGGMVIALIFLGWAAFNAFNLHSIVHVIPSLLYLAMMIMGLLALFGKFGLKDTGELHFNFVRVAMIFTWIILLLYVAVGPVISLVWDTNPNLTVTYNQADGVYPGKYPQKYDGTAPVVNNPRGLENLHLSPASWSHVAIFWILVLWIFGEPISKLINSPTLIFMVVTTIPMAPLFNSFGRIAAWLGLPSGIGGMWFAAHPLKFFNDFVLIVIVAIVLYRLKQKGSNQ
ncbi:MAG: hypothetical protein QME51_03910 [Planctomycetota bacterium]|nr:hypothetical protein [Planctomycetota bacterium]